MEFDPQAYIEAAGEGSFSTEAPVVPADEYLATVSDIKFSGGIVSKEESKNYGKPWLSLNVTYKIEDSRLKESMGRDTALVTQRLMLDLTDELDPSTGQPRIDRSRGKNFRLGRALAALGLNEDFKDFRAMIGRTARIKVKHRIYEGAPQAEVDSVAAPQQ